jgi:polar amino acid transport system substrate-binding protein
VLVGSLRGYVYTVGVRNSRTTKTAAVAVVAFFGLSLAACSKDKAVDTTATAETAAIDTTVAASADSTMDPNMKMDTTVAAAAETTAAMAVETVAAAPAAGAAMSADCAKDKLTLVSAGKLTVGTDSPAYGPWFSDDKPANGKGFESAVAFAVAAKLGFAPADVTWNVVKFDSAFAPGKKNFDFDINQVSINAARAEAIDFSDGYYDANQSVVGFADSPVAGAKTIADLKTAKLGAQQGTTSYDFIKNVIKPNAEPLIYNDNNAAKAALNAKQIDAIVLDLPTAFYVSAVEIEGTKVIGQFVSEQNGKQEQFGMVFEKGNKLRDCVNEALAAMKADGTLAGIQQAELSDATSAPIIK